MSDIFPEIEGVDLPPRKHSRVGIVSFVLSIVFGAVFFVSFCICAAIALEAEQKGAAASSVPGPDLLLPICFLMGALFASIVPLQTGRAVGARRGRTSDRGRTNEVLHRRPRMG